MIKAERKVLESRDLLGRISLSCQAVCDRRREGAGTHDRGLDGSSHKPEPGITPLPEWAEKPA